MKQTPETTNNTTPSAPIAGAAMAGKAVSKCIAGGYASPKIPDLAMLIFTIFIYSGCDVATTKAMMWSLHCCAQIRTSPIWQLLCV